MLKIGAFFIVICLRKKAFYYSVYVVCVCDFRFDPLSAWNHFALLTANVKNYDEKPPLNLSIINDGHIYLPLEFCQAILLYTIF